MNGNFVEIEDPSENYTPTQEEIEEFGKWLGCELPQDKPLLWIAEEALTAKIPPPWKYYCRKDGSGQPFYFNPETGESLWDHPLDKKYKELFQQEKKKLLNATKPQSALKNSPKQSITSSEFDNDYSPPKANITPTKQSKKKQNSSQELLSTEKTAQIPKAAQEMFDEDINGLMQEHELYMKQLQAENEAKIHEMEVKLADAFDEKMKEEQEKLEEKLNELKSNNYNILNEAQKAKLQNQEEFYSSQKKKLEEDFNNQIASMNQSHKLEIEKRKIEMESEKSKLELSHISKITEMKTNYQKEVTELTTKNQANSIALKEKATREVEIMRKKVKRQIEALKSSRELEQLKQEHEEKKQELIQAQEREMQKLKNKHEQTKRLLSQQFSGEIDEIKSDGMEMFDQSDFSELRTAHNLRKRKLERQYKAEIEELNADHESEIESLKNQHAKVISQLKEELEEEKREIESEKEDLEIKRKRELDKVNEECNNEMNKIREEFQGRKQREKSAFQQEMQIMMTMMESEKMKAQALLRREIDEMNRRTIDAPKQYQEQVQTPLIERKYIPRMRFERPPPLTILPIAKPKYYTFSMQKIFSQNETVKAAQVLDLGAKEDAKEELPKKERASAIIDSPAPSVSHVSEFTYLGRNQTSTEKLDKMKNKVSKLNDQFNSTCKSIDDSMSDISSQNEDVMNSFRSFIAQENKSITDASMQFNLQATQMRKALQETLQSVEQTLRSSLQVPNAIPVQVPVQNMQHQPQSPSSVYDESSFTRSAIRRRKKDVSFSINENSVSGLDTDSKKILKMWKKSRETRRIKSNRDEY